MSALTDTIAETHGQFLTKSRTRPTGSIEKVRECLCGHPLAWSSLEETRAEHLAHVIEVTAEMVTWASKARVRAQNLPAQELPTPATHIDWQTHNLALARAVAALPEGPPRGRGAWLLDEIAEAAAQYDLLAPSDRPALRP